MKRTSRPFAWRWQLPSQQSYNDTLEEWLKNRPAGQLESYALTDIIARLMDHWNGKPLAEPVTAVTAIDIDAIKAELRDELRDELKFWLVNLIGNVESMQTITDAGRQVQAGTPIPDVLIDNILEDFGKDRG